jgi:hypothetical protein
VESGGASRGHQRRIRGGGVENPRAPAGKPPPAWFSLLFAGCPACTLRRTKQPRRTRHAASGSFLGRGLEGAVAGGVRASWVTRGRRAARCPCGRRLARFLRSTRTTGAASESQMGDARRPDAVCSSRIVGPAGASGVGLAAPTVFSLATCALSVTTAELARSSQRRRGVRCSHNSPTPGHGSWTSSLAPSHSADKSASLHRIDACLNSLI